VWNAWSTTGLYYLSCSVTEGLGVKNHEWATKAPSKHTVERSDCNRSRKAPPMRLTLLDLQFMCIYILNVHFDGHTDPAVCFSWDPVDLKAVNDPRTDVIRTWCWWSGLWDVVWRSEGLLRKTPGHLRYDRRLRG